MISGLKTEQELGFMNKRFMEFIKKVFEEASKEELEKAIKIFMNSETAEYLMEGREGFDLTNNEDSSEAVRRFGLKRIMEYGLKDGQIGMFWAIWNGENGTPIFKAQNIDEFIKEAYPFMLSSIIQNPWECSRNLWHQIADGILKLIYREYNN